MNLTNIRAVKNIQLKRFNSEQTGKIVTNEEIIQAKADKQETKIDNS